MLRWFLQLVGRDDAATAVEYAVMLALILMVVFGSVVLLGQSTQTLFQNGNDQLNAVGFGAS